MNETSYRKSLERHTVPHLSDYWKIHDSFKNGVPDALLEGAHRDLWVEYKYIKTLPKRDTTMIDLTNPNKYLSLHQQKWLERRYHLRQDTLVLVGAPVGSVLFWDLSWKRPISTASFRQQAVSTKDAARWIVNAVNENDTRQPNNDRPRCAGLR